MASLNPGGEMIVDKAKKIIIVGAHIVFMFWTKSWAFLNSIYPI